MSKKSSILGRVGGFALAEMLLAAAVVGLIIASAMPMLNRMADDRASTQTAEEMKAFQEVAVAHLRANRADYEAAMTNGTGAASLCKIGVASDGSGGTTANDTTLHTCATDVSMLLYLKALPSTFKLKNAYGEQWVAIHRQVYDGATYTGGIETLVVSAAVTTGGSALPANNRRYQKAQAAAHASGGSAGVVPDTDRETCVAKRASTTYQICGDGWKVNLADYITAAQLTAFGNRLPN